MTNDDWGVSASDEGRYRLLVDAITDYAIYMLDPTGIITSWNSGAERLKGYTAEEILGQHFSRFYTPEEREAGLPAVAIDTAARTGRFEREGWRARKDGSRFWANVVIDAIRTPNGRLVGFAKITRDLTERRKAEEALRRSEEQFRLLVESVTDYAIYMLDAGGHVASWNAGAQRIKGYRPEEIIGSHFSRFYTEEDRAGGVPQEGLETARRQGRWEREGLRVRKDGTTFWASVVIDAIYDANGDVRGFAKVTRDITERKRAQAEIENAREALFQSQKMEALGQLTGGVAHDFNNLIMVGLSGLELLRRRVPSDPHTFMLIENIKQALQRGSTLTQRMLAFARRQELKLEAVDVVAQLRALEGFLRRAIGPTVRIDMQIPTNLPPARTDANQFDNALLNLVVNARDAMADGGVVTIGGRVAPAKEGPTSLKPGDHVVISVADTGEGMDEVTLARATEPFFTTKGIGKGTGLGLSMVHGLAAQSGGALAITSRKHEGTVVEIWLPVSQAQVMHPPAEQARHRRGPQFVIMLVDDDDLVLTNTSSLLDDLGHYVITASSGFEALETMKKHPHLDAIITDYAMPRMNGIEFGHSVRAERPDVPIILASGFAEVRDWNDFIQLKKPYTQEQLQDVLIRAVPTPGALKK